MIDIYMEAKKRHFFTDIEFGTTSAHSCALRMSSDLRNISSLHLIEVYSKEVDTCGDHVLLTTGSSIRAAFWATGYQDDGVLLVQGDRETFISNNAISSLRFIEV